MATIKDIAKAAGVSHGTASNVLNGRGGVSYQKMRLVEQAARAMGYAIDEKASLLRRGRTRTIAIMLPGIGDKRYADLYAGIASEARGLGYSTRLFTSAGLPDAEIGAVNEILTLKACAVLAVSCLSHPAMEYGVFAQRGVPILFLERPPLDASLPSRTFDMAEAAHALSLVLGKGRASVLCGERRYGDQAALCAAIGAPDADVYEFSPADPTRAISALVGRVDAPPRTVCASEEMADLLLNTWREGREGELRVAVLSSLRWSPNPHVACVCLNYRRMGSEAARDVITAAGGGEMPSSRVYPVSAVRAPVRLNAILRGKTVRVLSHATPTTEALRRLLPRFTQQTGIGVEMHTCSLDEFFARVAGDGASGWDAVRLDPSTLPYLAPRLLTPLDKLASGDGSRFLPSVMDGLRALGGASFALPFDISVQMLFYRRQLLENPAQYRAYLESAQKPLTVPVTYAEFDSVCRFFTRAYRAESPCAYGACFPPGRPTSVASDYLPRLLSAGGFALGADGRLALSTSVALETFRAYTAYSSCAWRSGAASWSDVAAGFARGEAAMCVLYAHHAAGFAFAQRAHSGADIGFAPVPGGKPLLAGGFLGVTRHSAIPEEAYRFAAWATGEDIAPELVMMGGTSSCALPYEHGELLEMFPWLEALPRLIRDGIRRPVLRASDVDYNQRDLEHALGVRLLKMADGEETPGEALAVLRRALEGIGTKDHTAREENL